MNMNKPSIAIDMDGVIADLMTTWIDRINEVEGENLKLEEITDWEILKFVKCGTKIFDQLDYDLFRNLPVICDSQEVAKELYEHYRVNIVTTATQKK